MATCNGRIDVGRYAIEIKFVHIDRLADAIINQTLYCLSWYNNRLSTAVYNFMQTQKERQPCKIKASAINKKSARRRTRSGGPRTARTGAERRHRTRKAFLAEMPEIREMLINIGFAETSEIRYVR